MQRPDLGGVGSSEGLLDEQDDVVPLDHRIGAHGPVLHLGGPDSRPGASASRDRLFGPAEVVEVLVVVLDQVEDRHAQLATGA